MPPPSRASTDAPTLTSGQRPRVDPSPTPRRYGRRRPTRPPTRPFVVWRGAEQAPGGEESADVVDPIELLDDEDDHFVPGPTAPLPPQEDLSFWGIVAGLVGGPLLLLWLVLFRPDVSGWWTLGALGMIAGGFVLLVLRQPHSRDEDDPDNGARV